jgi:hypothetical protein
MQQTSLKEKQRVAICYIATGNYIYFWEGFYKSSEEFLLPGVNKQYFLFTSEKEVQVQNNVTVFNTPSVDWPYSTLRKFSYLLSIEELLKEYEYVFYFNANTVFVEKITLEEYFPSDNIELVVVAQQFFCLGNRKSFPFESRESISAYIAPNNFEMKRYYAAGFLGGKCADFLKLCRKISLWVNVDLKCDRIAVWHDESYFNRYISEYKGLIRVLHPGYINSDDAVSLFERRVKLVDKQILMGEVNFRDPNRELKPNLYDLVLSRLRYVIVVFLEKNFFKSSKRVIELRGGLGNQMFIYAFGLALQVSRPKLNILFNVNKLEHYDSKLEDLFNLQIKKTIFGRRYYRAIDSIVRNSLAYFFRIRTRPREYSSEDLYYLEELYEVSSFLYYMGYFQSEKYFVDVAEQVRSAFSFEALELSDIEASYLSSILDAESVSLHIRGGDYRTTNGKGHLMDEEKLIRYYLESIGHIKKSRSNPKFFIFTDDWPYASRIVNVLKSYSEFDSEYIECRREPIKDLYFMTKCKHNIITNSSFSWWGAWLNISSDKIVTAPKWWGDFPYSIDDLLPSSWVRFG